MKADLAPYHISQNEPHISGTLGQAPHEIGVPVSAVGHIDPHAVTVSYQLLLQVAPYAVQHLKLKFVRRNVSLRRKLNGRRNHVLIVSRDAVIYTRAQEHLSELDVVRIDVGFLRERDRRRLFVRALTQSNPGAELQQFLSVLLAAKQISLK